MATRRLRFALWQHHHHLTEQALVRESVAQHLVGLADTLRVMGQPEAARCLVEVAFHVRVKAICRSAQAEALDWRRGMPV
jgi:hypothetical protein